MKKHRRFWSILAVAVLLMTAAGIPTLAAQDSEPTREETFKVAISERPPTSICIRVVAAKPSERHTSQSRCMYTTGCW